MGDLDIYYSLSFYLVSIKMADIDNDPFGGMECPASGEHDRTEEPTDEHIPLSPVTPGGRSTWEPERE